MPTPARTYPTSSAFAVVYRTGGWARCRWHRTVGESRELAKVTAADLRRSGYKAFVVDRAQSERVGLPEGWEALPQA